MAVDWNIVDEIRLFRWVSEFKPVGIHRHFHMFCILERMNNPDKYPVITLQKETYHRPPKLFTSKDIWLKLKQYYNLDEANNIENEFMINHDHNEGNEKNNLHEQVFIDELKLIENDSQFNDTKLLQNGYRLMTETKDFSLPWDEYGDLILSKAIKKKNSVTNKEDSNIIINNKDDDSRLKFANNIGGTTVKDNKNIIKINSTQIENQNMIKQERVLTSRSIDSAMTEGTECRVIEKYDNPNESNKTDEKVSINIEQNQNNNIQTHHTELVNKDVEHFDKNENCKNNVTQINNEMKPIGNVKGNDKIENHKTASSDRDVPCVMVENIKKVDKIENHEKIENRTETKTELNDESEDINKQKDVVLGKDTNGSEVIEINEQLGLNKEEETKDTIEESKEEEKQELQPEENKEAKEKVQGGSNKDTNQVTKRKDMQGKEIGETKKEEIVEKRSQEEKMVEAVQQVQKRQLEDVKEEAKVEADKKPDKGIEIQDLQKKTEAPSETNNDNELQADQDEKRDNEKTEDNTEVVVKKLDNKELLSEEGEETTKEEKEDDNEVNEGKKRNEQSSDKQNTKEVQLENEYDKQEHEIPQRHRKKRVYPRAHRISSRLRRKAYGNETNKESKVESVKESDDQLTEERKNVENEKTTLKHKLNTEQDMVDNEPLAKRTRHSSHAKAVNIEDSENQQNREETTSSASSSKRGRRKNSNKILEPTRFSSRLRNRK